MRTQSLQKTRRHEGGLVKVENRAIAKRQKEQLQREAKGQLPREKILDLRNHQ